MGGLSRAWLDILFDVLEKRVDDVEFRQFWAVQGTPSQTSSSVLSIASLMSTSGSTNTCSKEFWAHIYPQQQLSRYFIPVTVSRSSSRLGKLGKSTSPKRRGSYCLCKPLFPMGSRNCLGTSVLSGGGFGRALLAALQLSGSLHATSSHWFCPSSLPGLSITLPGIISQMTQDFCSGATFREPKLRTPLTKCFYMSLYLSILEVLELLCFSNWLWRFTC